MEVTKSLICLVLIFSISACSNTPELETGEIKTVQLLKEALFKKNIKKTFVDARMLLSRQQIDAANIPVLFVELESGQNGTLTPYPGQGIGQTWIGADGATLTLDQGTLKASRGMGDDIMSSVSKIPPWAKITNSSDYSKKLNYLSGNNKILTRNFECKIKKMNGKTMLVIWDVSFKVRQYSEDCTSQKKTVRNIYFVDAQNIVRQSRQYHSETLGFVITQRLER